MYDTLDSLIVAAVRRRVNPLDRPVWMEATGPKLTGRIVTILMAMQIAAQTQRHQLPLKNDTDGRLAGISCRGRVLE